jgi:thioredoxin 1
MQQSISLTDDNFEKELGDSKIPVLVDFWANWCGPCRMISPIIEEIAEDYRDKVRVTKLNVDENPMATSRYGVRSIPTLIIFKDGEPAEKIIGAVPKRHIVEIIEGVLNKN